MITKDDIERINLLGDRLEELNKPLRIDEYNSPKNRDDEKTKLFDAHTSGGIYNPQFVYDSPPESWEKPLEAFILEIDPSKTEWDGFIYASARQTLDVLKTLMDKSKR